MASLHPYFSVVIPTYERPRQLAACLEAVARQDYAPDRFEIIVVNDGGHRSVEDAIDQAGDGPRIRLVHQDNAGPAAARNHGARIASGEYIAFTDDDCAPAAGWLKSFSKEFQAHPECMVGGSTVNSLDSNAYSRVSQDLVSFLYFYYGQQPGEGRFFASNNMSVPSRLFHELGGFDESFPLAAGEDREFCHRWLDSGGAMVFAPDAIVAHRHSLTLSRFLRQHYNYGRGAARLRRVRKRRGQSRLRVEPLSFYSTLVLYPVGQRGARALPDAALMLLTQVANAVGYAVDLASARFVSAHVRTLDDKAVM